MDASTANVLSALATIFSAVVSAGSLVVSIWAARQAKQAVHTVKHYGPVFHINKTKQ